MAYTVTNYPHKKALIEDFKAGKQIEVFQPNDMLGRGVPDGRASIEGPHYPKPHKWYASVEVKNGVIVKVK